MFSETTIIKLFWSQSEVLALPTWCLTSQFSVCEHISQSIFESGNPHRKHPKYSISGGSRISQRRRQPETGVYQPIIWQHFCQKLHENERIWTDGGVSLVPPLGSATVNYFDGVVSMVTAKLRGDR